MASSTARHLRRMWQSVPLHRLKQGTSLTITSNLSHPTHITFKPAWRDDGIAELQHVFLKGDTQVEMVVNKEAGSTITSLERIESHVSIELKAIAAIAEATSATTKDETYSHGGEAYSDSVPQVPPKPVDKVILDDGTHVLRPLEEYSNLPHGTSRTDYHDGIAHIAQQQKGDSFDENKLGTFLTIQMPEKTNLICTIKNGSITITDKVEGDVRLSAGAGDIVVKKLRGHVIDLKTDSSESVIYASSLLESQTLSVSTPGRFRAKQIHANTVNVDVNRQDCSGQIRIMDEGDDEGSLVDISSLFVSGNGGATVAVKGNFPLQRRAVRIKSHHGPLAVSTDGMPKPSEFNSMTEEIYAVVELGGVNGSCEVAITGSLHNHAEGWSSCTVHVDSLAQDSVSLVTADRGDISVTLDRKAEADLRLASLPNAECLSETGALLAEEEDSTQLVKVLKHLPSSSEILKNASSVKIQTKAFTSRPETSFSSESVTYIDGWVENKSEEPDSRFERKARGAGKIRHEGAAEQALHGFGEGNESEDYLRPLFAVVGTDKIHVETVSWLGAIARRYGLEETENRELGRTASRRGRPTGTAIAPE